MTCRENDQIAWLELVAVIVGMYSFGEYVRDSLLSVYIDNDAVAAMVRNGSADTCAMECDNALGNLWLQAGEWRTSVWAFPVESAANCSDGPTRGRYDTIKKLKAREVPAVVPEWLFQVWDGPPFEFLTRSLKGDLVFFQ